MFRSYNTIQAHPINQGEPKLFYGLSNRVDVGSYPQHLSLHRTYGSRIRRYIHIGERKL